MTEAFFVTATGTDIGKTYVLCQLIRALRAKGKKVAAAKPIISGFDPGDAGTDTAQIISALGKTHDMRTIEAISPWRFVPPLSPDMAARQAGAELDLTEIVNFSEAFIERASGEGYDYVFIEGVGGVCVPLNEEKLVCDWMAMLDIPALLVAGTYLGSMSHTLTAKRVLDMCDIVTHSLWLNESPGSTVDMQETATSLSHFMACPIVPVMCDEVEGFNNLTKILDR